MPATSPDGSSGFPQSLAVATYTADDLAALLKCSVRSIWRMRDRRELPAHVQLGKLVRWPRVLVDEWLASPTRRSAH